MSGRTGLHAHLDMSLRASSGLLGMARLATAPRCRRQSMSQERPEVTEVGRPASQLPEAHLDTSTGLGAMATNRQPATGPIVPSVRSCAALCASHPAAAAASSAFAVVNPISTRRSTHVRRLCLCRCRACECQVSSPGSGATILASTTGFQCSQPSSKPVASQGHFVCKRASLLCSQLISSNSLLQEFKCPFGELP